MTLRNSEKMFFKVMMFNQQGSSLKLSRKQETNEQMIEAERIKKWQL